MRLFLTFYFTLVSLNFLLINKIAFLFYKNEEFQGY